MVVVEWGQEEVVPAVVEDLVARGKGWGSSRRKPEAEPPDDGLEISPPGVARGLLLGLGSRVGVPALCNECPAST